MPRVAELRPLPIMREWHDANIVRRERIEPRANRVRVLKVRTPATPEDLRAIAAISPDRVTYCPGIPTKRFARQVQGSTELTEAQRTYLWDVVWRFRRQISDQSLIAIAEKLKQAKERL